MKRMIVSSNTSNNLITRLNDYLNIELSKTCDLVFKVHKHGFRVTRDFGQVSFTISYDIDTKYVEMIDLGYTSNDVYKGLASDILYLTANYAYEHDLLEEDTIEGSR